MDIKRHAVLSLLALVAGLAVVWWLEPTTSGGVGLIMTVFVVLFNAVGALTGKRPAPGKENAAPDA